MFMISYMLQSCAKTKRIFYVQSFCNTIYFFQNTYRRIQSTGCPWKPGYGPLARYVKLRVAHAPGMPGTFFPPPRVSDPDMPHGTCVTHVPWFMPGSLTSGFLWHPWRGKRSRHSRRMRNPWYIVSGKRPMGHILFVLSLVCIQSLVSLRYVWYHVILDRVLTEFDCIRILCTYVK